MYSKPRNIGYEHEEGFYSEYVRFCTNYLTEEALAWLIAKKQPRAGCGGTCERDQCETM